jgi:hypothetical protein
MPRSPLILTFVDASYLPLLEIWLARLRTLGVERVKVYCLDEATLEWCLTRKVDASRITWTGNLHDLWVQRIRIFGDLLAAGEEIVHSDTDAIWIRNPFRFGSAAARDEDLIFSQGTVWPPDVHDRWGFVLCCGWFWAKPRAAVRTFFKALELDVQASGDDQISVNRLLAACEDVRWSHGRTGDYQLPFHDRLVQCWRQPIRATVAGGLAVALLPQREFQRLPEASDQAVVKHYVSPKNCRQKLEVFRASGLIG